MSRIAKKPVPIPKGVEVALQDQQITVKGTKGSLTHFIHNAVNVELAQDVLTFVPNKASAAADALAGTTRALVNNMVHGVSQGFERKLQLVGVGYRAQVKGKTLDLTLGFSHPVSFAIPEGIVIEMAGQTEILIKGIDKQQVGQVAANIRAFRPPEPYKGKGVRYANEVIVLKETKKK
ncbi:MAG: 50S ribosomal protein L6 [Beggiatoa sp. IS2]|nr:MAG: 50S ribosomal protein L6 [Beggiatoa sp. IS2]